MKTKLISKILCGVLAVTTITSSGMMLASASFRNFETFYWCFLNFGHSDPQPKNTDSGVFCWEQNGPSYNVTVEEGMTEDGDFYNAHGGDYYDIAPQTDNYLPNYVNEDGCAYARLYFWDYAHPKDGHEGCWGPDDR